MTVWCVVIEWMHPADGSAAEVYAVCETEARAKEEEQRAIDQYSGPGFNHQPYFNPATEEEEEDWDFATEVVERTVTP